MDTPQSYEVQLQKDGRQAYVVLPFDARQRFGRPKGGLFVAGTLNGLLYRSRLVSLGEGRQALFVAAPLVKKLDVAVGDMLQATFMPDIEDEAPATRPEAPTTAGMDVLAAIETRGSIRKFTEQPVEPPLVDAVLNAGFCAPSATNKRPWHFVVVQNAALRKTLSGGSPFAGMVAEAPLALVVCGDKTRQGMEEFLYQDCAAAVQNMLLCAHGLGLGAVWCGVRRRGSFEKLIGEALALPEKITPVAVLALGWPAQQKAQPPRFVQSRVHHEGW